MASLPPSNPPPTDERIPEHLANERTFLSWLRTSVGLMAFGFVVERFAIFTQQVSLILNKEHVSNPIASAFHPGATLTIGQVIISLGLLICLLSFFQFRYQQRQIQQYQYRPSLALDLFLCVSITLMGMLLIMYLNFAF